MGSDQQADSPGRPVSIGRYPVIDRIGGGGMGVVYLARDTALDRLVAIKVMRHGFDTPDLRERFVREVRALASLRHPCIVTPFEFGEFEGQPFLVMEYVRGKTLEEIVRARTPLSLARRLQLAEDLCRGLHHAHEQGIVHRDVKPANIVVDNEGTLKLLDFGIAKGAQQGLTSSGLIGTPRYMSPEQVGGLPVTRRSDMFSVGLVVYELLAYQPAFPDEGQFAVMDAIMHRQPRPLGTLVSGLDPRISRIVERAIEKDVELRYRDLAHMRRDIEHVKHELLVASPDHGTQITPKPKVGVQLEDLARRRAQQVTANIEAAERALEGGDYDAALAAAEDALMLAPENDSALEVLHRVQTARAEREAAHHLREAREHLERNDVSQAEACIEEALAIAPSLADLPDLMRELEDARSRHQDRGRALKTALARARFAFVDGAYESALHAADEALTIDPADSQALSLRADAQLALDHERRREPRSPATKNSADVRRPGYQAAAAPLASPSTSRQAAYAPPPFPEARTPAAGPAPHTAELSVAVADVSRPAVAWPEPDSAVGDRAGGRAWLTGGGSTAQAASSAAGLGASALTHLALGTVATVFVLTRPPLPPAVKDAGRVFLAGAPALHMTTPQVEQPAPERPRPAKPSERAPETAVPNPLPNPAPPTSAPSTVQPEIVLPAPEPRPDAPIDAVFGTNTELMPPPPPPPPPPGRLNEAPVSNVDSAPLLRVQVRPKFPAGAHGFVDVRVIVQRDGHVSRVEILSDTPYAQLVTDAAMRCEFQPARRRGLPVAALAIIRFQVDTLR